jgi:hypothetical protein
MTDPIREAAAKLYDEQLVPSGRLAAVNAILAFAKAQRLKEVEAMQAFRSTWGELANIDHWLTQRSKELR